jgi:steroid delta-isomerase-like uncharacterized protein
MSQGGAPRAADLADLSPEARRHALVARMMLDYRDDAVVNDPLFARPLVGKAAIATHKTAEQIALTEIDFQLGERWTNGNQLIANWVVTGLHSGPYYGIPATNRRIRIAGSTVVTRDDRGKIIQETLYYDAVEMRRQLMGEPPSETAIDLPPDAPRGDAQ